jgi:hypothetical protein
MWFVSCSKSWDGLKALRGNRLKVSHGRLFVQPRVKSEKRG